MSDPITIIPLEQLQPTDRNARKIDGASIDYLAASIAAHGLIHNLVVMDSPTDPAYPVIYPVIAGGRRLRALRALAEAGQLPAALQSGIPCKVVDEDHAHEASLAENVIREDMHPADEFDAFHQLSQGPDGISVGEIAARFGKSERYVQQRLKLANVAPEILAEYRKGDATLEQMMALALTDDQEQQRKVWNGARAQWQRSPDELRGAITLTELSARSTHARYIGLEAYEKAGGHVRRDLFGQEGDCYLVDVELVEQLVQEKLERAAARVAKEGWKWVEARIRFDYSDEAQFGRAPFDYKGSKPVFAKEVKATAGAIVTLGYNGETDIKRGLVRPEDRREASKAAGDKEIRGGKKKRQPGQMSFAVIQRLQAEGNCIAQQIISEDTHLALGLLAAELADYVFFGGSVHPPRQWIQIGRQHSGRMPGNLQPVVDASEWSAQREDMMKEWRARIPQKRSELRAWVMKQPQVEIARLLAFLVAREIDTVDVFENSTNGITGLAALTGIEFEKHWKVTEAWLATLPKSVVLKLVEDAAGKKAAAPLAKLKRAQIAHEAVDLFPPGWVPDALRTSKPKRTRKKKAA